MIGYTVNVHILNLLGYIQESQTWVLAPMNRKEYLYNGISVN